MNAARWARRIGASRWTPLLVIVALAVLGALAFHEFNFHRGQRNDFTKHAEAARRWLQRGRAHPHFLYHLLLHIGSGFSNAVWPMRAAGVAIATAALVAKLAISALLFRRLAERSARPLAQGALALLLVALCFAAPIPNWWSFPRVYLGQFTATVWHNPTVILGMPLWLLVIALLDDARGSPRRAMLGGLFLAVSVFAKPHFALALLPVLLVLTVLRRLRPSVFLLYAVPASGCLLLQLHYGTGSETIGPILLRPLEVWSDLSPQPLASLGLSLAFPLTLLACFGMRLRERRLLLLAWLLFGVALAQFTLFAEGGRRMAHANFYWGTVPGLYLIFLISLAELARLWDARARGALRARLVLCAGVLALHVAGGILFYARTLQGHNWKA